MKFCGVMYGIHSIVEHTDHIYLAADGRYAQGELDYEGSGTIENIEAYLYELRALAGWNFGQLTIFSGYGYRYLNDDGNGRITSTGLLGYERESNYHYVPAGLKWMSGSLTLKAEIDVLVEGKQVSHFELLDPLLEEVNQKQNSGVGFKASIDWVWKNVTFGPYIRTWKIQNSKSDQGYIEPKNSSVEVGGAFGIRW